MQTENDIIIHTPLVKCGCGKQSIKFNGNRPYCGTCGGELDRATRRRVMQFVKKTIKKHTRIQPQTVMHTAPIIDPVKPTIWERIKKFFSRS